MLSFFLISIELIFLNLDHGPIIYYHHHYYYYYYLYKPDFKLYKKVAPWQKVITRLISGFASKLSDQRLPWSISKKTRLSGASRADSDDDQVRSCKDQTEIKITIYIYFFFFRFFAASFVNNAFRMQVSSWIDKISGLSSELLSMVTEKQLDHSHVRKSANYAYEGVGFI